MLKLLGVCCYVFLLFISNKSKLITNQFKIFRHFDSQILELCSLVTRFLVVSYTVKLTQLIYLFIYNFSNEKTNQKLFFLLPCVCGNRAQVFLWEIVMTRTTMIRQRITTSSSASSIGTPPISTITLNGLENPSFQLIIHKLNSKK